MVGRTEAEAREKFEALQDLVQPEVGPDLLAGLSGGEDLSSYPVDGPLPPLPESEAGKSRQSLLIDLARRESLTIKQLCSGVVVRPISTAPARFSRATEGAS